MAKYNLGCGSDYKRGFINVDICSPMADVREDLRQDWSFIPDVSADFVFANNVFEHLPDKMHTMNELHRVLKVGGRAELYIPSTDGRGAWQDPTHVSFWNKNSWRYWCSNHDAGLTLMNQRNGFRGDFKLIELNEFEIAEKIIMTKIILEKAK